MKAAIDPSPSRRQVLRLTAMVTACAVVTKVPNAEEALKGEGGNSYVPADGVATFESVWQTVRERFYDPRHNGLDWPAVRERYLLDVQRATSQDSLARVINTMLSELHASHTRFYTPDEPEYYQLADIFAGALQRRGLQRAFPDGHISYPGIGILSRLEATGRNVITGVIDGTPAQEAGLRAGDETIAVNGTAFEPIGSFRGKVGKSVVLEVHRGASVLQVPVIPIDLKPTKMFLRGLESSARIIESNGRRIGYVHVWCYAGSIYQRALESLLSQGVLRDADALIWDLRDGWGGAQPQYLDLFNARVPTMQVTDRNGRSELVNVKWRKPVAMLINGGTRSGKEVLAYGFKKYRLGELIGTRTEGAVLAATAFLIGSGLLLLAVEDVRVDGERLESVGVTPTIEVLADVASAGSDDPQLSRAVALLSGT
ncbi:S41 family peptidase [Bradyrhizobium sp. CCGUVB1N3]|uniref:S41 family peptidase n=1 Tax=Bradyrhizobium sp. CCGUVB1N3 TaxID=2949629 RepID=UPI0020B3E984|nr:S41 family peptidase [Bradyrhizobium sp. CCGUVB1N3]MCP3471745.1 S41 family peptidase [Bradyrhizobium sp. CCGUVB1N3]